MQIADSFDVGSLQVNIFYDEIPDDPRTWDNAGHMVCFHSKYTLGDKHDYKERDYNSWEGLEDHILTDYPDAVILPLYLYDHSGITMNTTGFSCPWDSGLVGLIYLSPSEAIRELGFEEGTDWEAVLRGEVETYDQYLRGDVYGYEIIDEKGEPLGRVGGFYGYDGCVDEATAEAEFILKNLNFHKQLRTIE